MRIYNEDRDEREQRLMHAYDDHIPVMMIIIIIMDHVVDFKANDHHNIVNIDGDNDIFNNYDLNNDDDYHII